jgi:hypothetical protein
MLRPHTYTKNVNGVTVQYTAMVTLLCSNMQGYAFGPPSCRPNPHTTGVPVSPVDTKYIKTLFKTHPIIAV